MNSQLKSRPTTIVWGAILAAIAAIAILATTNGFDVTGPSTVLWFVVGVGGLLVVGALVGGIVRAVRGASTDSANETDSASAEHQPID